MKHPRILALLFISALGTAPATLAAVSDAEFSALKSTLLALVKRVEMLESENTQLEVRLTETQELAMRPGKVDTRQESAWSDKIKISGDFRYRHEGFNSEGNDNRNRNRIRARTAIKAQVNDDLRVVVGLASGSSDPRSANQTLSDLGTSKSFNLDLAYMDWTVNENFSVIAGKFPNNLYQAGKNQLLWDSDYNPEGAALNYTSGNFFSRAAVHWLESDSKSNNDDFSWSLQSGFITAIGDARLTTGVGYLQVPVKGNTVYFGDADDFFGNSFTCANAATLNDCSYLNDYEDLQVFAQLDTRLADQSLLLFADFVRNLDARRLDTAWTVGLKLGQASAAGTWEVGYAYQDIDADAIFGALTNSDFSDGETDSKGHIVSAGYAINKSWSLALTYFLNTRHKDLGVEQDYKRVQLDTKIKF